MAAVPVVSKASANALVLSSIALAATGDTLQYLKGKGQELLLFNPSGNDITVVIDGSGGTVVIVPGTAGSQINVAPGLAINVAANSLAYQNLDKAELFLQGQVAITASTGSVIRATVVQP